MKGRHILTFLGIAAIFTAMASALCFFGVWIPNQPSQAEYPVRGIDVSHHQGDIRWDAVAASGIHFAYIKATEGASYDDPCFKQNWDAAAAAHIERGAYHFYTIGTPGKLQAAHFLSKVPMDASALPPAIDIELAGSNRDVGSVAQFQRDLSEFISILAAHYGRQPVIYSTRDFKNHYLQGISMGSWWASDVIFTPRQRADEPWKFWQFSWRGRISGVTGFVDLDVFSGSLQDFQAFLPAR